MKKITACASAAAALALSLHCGCAASGRTSLVSPEDIRTIKVYESEEKPGHNQWPSAFLDRSGDLCVIFQNISGDLKQTPSYDYRNHPENYRITRIGMKYDRTSGKFRRIWQKETQSTFCIMAPHPTKSGKVLGMRKVPEGLMVIETKDCGKTFSPIFMFPVSDLKLCPNDIRCIGDRVYLAAYDGRGGAYLSESEDEGKTWSKPFKFIKAHDNMSFHEPTLTELANGDVMVMLRTHRMDIPKHNGINYHSVILSRTGKGTWKAAKEQDTGFGFRGRPWLMRTSGGILVLAAPGHFMAFSLNEGKTWESGQYDFRIPEVKILWNGKIKPYDHNAETTVLELPDGSFYYSYFIGSDLPFPPPCDEYIGGTFFRLNRD